MKKTISYYPYKGVKLEDYPFKEDPLAALEEIKTNYPGEPILITGSLAFAAYMKNLIK